ncbi:MAG: cbb3-type cytochrome oxidase assembly protein CcoS [Pelovirga sp.]
MMTSTILLIFLSFCIGTGVWLFFLYAVKKGEFDDVEGPKYRMLDDDEEDQSDEKSDKNQQS